MELGSWVSLAGTEHWNSCPDLRLETLSEEKHEGSPEELREGRNGICNGVQGDFLKNNSLLTLWEFHIVHPNSLYLPVPPVLPSSLPCPAT